MSIIQNERIAVRVCQMHYLEDYSQKEIASILNISRAQISRIIATAKSRNIVSITVNDPFAREKHLEKQLSRQFNIDEAMVFDSKSLDDFGRQASQIFEIFVADGDRVGIMSGKTIYSLARAVTAINRRDLQFVPLLGGIGSENASWHANSIAQSMSQKSNGVSYVMNAPVTVKDSRIRDALAEEPDILSVLELGAKCNVSLVGIGEISLSSTTMLAGSMTAQDVHELHEAGAVCTMGNSYLDRDGRILDVPVMHRTIGQTLESIKGSKIIALAIGDTKIQAIKSALKSGFVNVFMTDMDTAQNILGVE